MGRAALRGSGCGGERGREGRWCWRRAPAGRDESGAFGGGSCGPGCQRPRCVSRALDCRAPSRGSHLRVRAGSTGGVSIHVDRRAHGSAQSCVVGQLCGDDPSFTAGGYNCAAHRPAWDGSQYNTFCGDSAVREACPESCGICSVRAPAPAWIATRGVGFAQTLLPPPPPPSWRLRRESSASPCADGLQSSRLRHAARPRILKPQGSPACSEIRHMQTAART